MSALWKVQHVSVAIERTPKEVYATASDPANLPRWASGLAGSVERVDGAWVAQSPMGQVKIRFAETNEFGVLDHDVTLESGLTVYNAMRVLPNSTGSEVVFSVFQRPGTSPEEYARDVEWVSRDLHSLKALLEGRSAGV